MHLQGVRAHARNKVELTVAVSALATSNCYSLSYDTCMLSPSSQRKTAPAAIARCTLTPSGGYEIRID